MAFTTDTRFPARMRAVTLAIAGSALALAVVAATATTLADLLRRPAAGAETSGTWAALDSTPPADLLAGLAALVLASCTCWLWAGALATLVRVLVRSDSAGRPPGVPRAVHRATLAGCGLALAGGALAPAAAVPTGLHEEAERVSLRTPSAAPPAPPPADTWTVRRGDTLWAIARASLRGDESLAPPHREVAARVRVLHRLNRDAVPDPDLIHPTQRLRLPAA